MSTPRKKLKFGQGIGAQPSVDKLPIGTEPDIWQQVWKRFGMLEQRLNDGSSSASSSSSGSSNTRWVDLTNGDPSAPELIFDAFGQVIVVLEYV